MIKHNEKTINILYASSDSNRVSARHHDHSRRGSIFLKLPSTIYLSIVKIERLPYLYTVNLLWLELYTFWQFFIIDLGMVWYQRWIQSTSRSSNDEVDLLEENRYFLANIKIFKKSYLCNGFLKKRKNAVKIGLRYDHREYFN